MTSRGSALSRSRARYCAPVLALGLAGFLAVRAPLAEAVGTFIVGTPRTTVDNAQLWAAHNRATPEFVGLAPLFWQIAPTRGGVRADIAYAQSAKETGYGRFGGVIDPTFKNPCGMKTTAGGSNSDPDAHKRFASWEEGITACIDHLALYAGAQGYPRADSPDPRHFPFLFGTARTVEELSGKWAPSPDYGFSIVRDYLNPMIGPQSGFDEWILLMNPSESPVTATVSAEQTGRAPVTRNLLLAPVSRATVLIDELIPEGDVSVRVTSGGPIVAERAMYFSYRGWGGGATGEGVAPPATSWFLAEGYESPGFDTFVLLYNPGPITATATATFLREVGGPIPVPAVIPPKGRFTITAGDVPGLGTASFSVAIASDQLVLVERSTYFDYQSPVTGKHRKGGSASRAVDSLGTTFDLAEGYSGPGFETWVLVANPNPVPVDITATYLTDAGTSTIESFAMPGNSRHTTLAGSLPGVAGTSHATHVEASMPVAVERAEYFGYGGIDGGSTAQATPSPGGDWYLAEGYAGAGFDTWILLSNPGPTPADITMTLAPEGGPPVVTTSQVAPWSRKTFNLGNLVGPLAASTHIAATAPIVVERSIYFDYQSPRGWKVSGGSASMGIQALSSEWFFAEGYVW
ncbi:MAG: hypothetical protein DCC49_11865 [Acidobacteria bacterium]|nr:MAG: hypothetical protein DCC49_11865 [Acidobacteriota bacterium]